MSSSKSSGRNSIIHCSAGYSIEEDRALCQVYLSISQDPIVGINQSKDQFWSRIETEYHEMLPTHITNPRTKRSLQSRMQLILLAIGKLKRCVQQIEDLNPSGASEQDIVSIS